MPAASTFATTSAVLPGGRLQEDAQGQLGPTSALLKWKNVRKRGQSLEFCTKRIKTTASEPCAGLKGFSLINIILLYVDYHCLIWLAQSEQ